VRVTVRLLKYIHPDVPYALTGPELPPTTWNPPIRIEWREEPDWLLDLCI